MPNQVGLETSRDSLFVLLEGERERMGERRERQKQRGGRVVVILFFKVFIILKYIKIIIFLF
jgi:hypothetical protein